MSLEIELEAIRTGAAIAPITDRAFIRITGSDATRWLNGMVTNSIQDLKPGEGNYNFLLSAQGRIQGDCTIYREPTEGDATFLLETEKSQLDTIHALLDKFIIMDDVELSESNSLESGILLLGTFASSKLESLGLPQVSINTFRSSETNTGSLVVLTTDTADRFELWSDEAQLAAVRTKLALPELSAAAIEAHRILSGTPKYGVDIRNTDTAKDLPQETNQTHALHFNKGCYVGQEIVERIRSRGQVHRVFTQFTLSGELPTTLPAPLEATLAGQARPGGEITSAVQIGDSMHALGYLRREFATAALTYSGGTATPKTTKL